MIHNHFTGSKQPSDVTDVNSYSRAERMRAPDTPQWLLCPLSRDVTSSPSDRRTVKSGERTDGRGVRVTVSRQRGRAQLSEKFHQLVRRFPGPDPSSCSRRGGAFLLRSTFVCVSAALPQTPPSFLRLRAAKHQFRASVMMRIIRLSPTSNVDLMDQATCACTSHSQPST